MKKQYGSGRIDNKHSNGRCRYIINVNVRNRENRKYKGLSYILKLYIYTYIYTKLQSLLRGQLNRYRYIFDINCLPYSVVCITLLIALTKTLRFWSLTSKHCHSNTVNVLCHVSVTSFPPVRDFRNSP